MGVVFILKKKNHTNIEWNNPPTTIPPMGQAPKKERCDLPCCQSKGKSSTTNNRNTPKEERPQIKPYKALFPLYPYNCTPKRLQRLKTAKNALKSNYII